MPWWEWPSQVLKYNLGSWIISFDFKIASLLPPIVNSGLCLALGLYYTSTGVGGVGSDYLQYSAASFTLFLINIALIIIFGLLMFKIKKVTPLGNQKKSGENQIVHGFSQREIDLSRTFINQIFW